MSNRGSPVRPAGAVRRLAQRAARDRGGQPRQHLRGRELRRPPIPALPVQGAGHSSGGCEPADDRRALTVAIDSALFLRRRTKRGRNADVFGVNASRRCDEITKCCERDGVFHVSHKMVECPSGCSPCWCRLSFTPACDRDGDAPTGRNHRSRTGVAGSFRWARRNRGDATQRGRTISAHDAG